MSLMGWCLLRVASVATEFDKLFYECFVGYIFVTF
jgi:hypothetical protein